MKLIFCCLLFAVAFAQDAPPPDTSSSSEGWTGAASFWKLHHWASNGYRRDRQRFDASSSKFSIENRNSVELILGSHLEFSSWILHLRGKYGWLINGEAPFSSPSGFGSPLSFPSFSLGAGYTADVLGAIGIRLPIYRRPGFQCSFIPAAGYSYSHLMNFSQGEKRDNTAAGWALAQMVKPNQQDWFGPYVQLRAEFRFMQSCEWNLFYQYHWPSVRSKFAGSVTRYESSTSLYQFSSVYRENYASQMGGGTDLKYRAPSGWVFGLHFEASSAWADQAQYSATEKEWILPSKTSIEETAEIAWVCYEVSMALGYQF